MAVSQTSAHLLPLLVVGIACIFSLALTTSNTTQVQYLPTPHNSTASTPTNAIPGSCQGVNLQDASRSISMAADVFLRDLTCKRSDANASLSEELFLEMEQNIRHLVDSSLKAFLIQGDNQSRGDLLDIFGVLESLSLGDNHDPTFIRLWFSLKMAPLLPYVAQSFLVQLGNQNISCTSYQQMMESMSTELQKTQDVDRELIYSNFIKVFLSRKNTSEPGCKDKSTGSEEWLQKNIGIFFEFATIKELKEMNKNFSAFEVLEKLSLQQKAELILDPDSGALEDVNFVREVLTSLNLSGKDEQLSQFFQTFAQISEKKNITFITNAAVRETILNISLTALAPALEVFGAQEFQLWFQVYLVPVMPSLRPAYLWVIPKDISCASYMAILTGLQKTLKFPLPLELSVGVNSSIAFLKDTFPRCSTPEPFTCKETAVDENLICAEVNRSLVQQTLAADNSSAALCSFTITEHACSMADQLAPQNLATLLKCWLEAKRHTLRPALSNALDALREVRLANLSDAELQSRTVIGDLVQRVIGPFLASPSTNFLFCLSSYNFSCLTYQIVVKELSNQRQLMNSDKQRAVFTYFIKPFLSRKESSDPGCTLSANGSQDWLQANLGSFAGFATVQDLTTFNPHLSPVSANDGFRWIEILSELAPSQVAQLLISTGSSNDTTLIDLAFERLEKGDALENLDKFLTQLTVNGQATVVGVLTEQQKAELILDPDSGALEDVNFVRDVLTSLNLSGKDEQLSQFFQTFAQISEKKNITFITNAAVRETILNISLTALAPALEVFGAQEFQLWFQVYLVPVMPSLRPAYLWVIPKDISCASYMAILTGLQKTLKFPLPLELSVGVNSSIAFLKDTFPRCSTPEPFTADQLAPQNLATLLKCWLESQTTYPVEAWKLFFQKVPSSLNDTLETFATMTSNNSRPALSNALDALREVRLANLSDAELQSRTVIGDLVQRVIGPFLASPSTNFLFCLSSYNFSCLTYQIVSWLHLIRQRESGLATGNLGSFAGFATVQDLTTLNPHLSPIEILSELAPSQVAQLLISTGSSNDTTLIDLAFERLEKGDALENLDKFLTQLTVNGQVLQFQTVVRDHAMTRAFYILRLHFLSFSSRELYLWFHERLLTILASFTPQMLNSTISSMSCANYHIVVSGIAKVFPAIPLLRRQGIASVLLAYLQNSTSVTNRTACRMGLETDVEWIETNLGPFSQYTTYSDLKAFNLSQATVVGVLTEQQKAELILDPDSGALEDVNFVRDVLTSLNLSGKDEQLSQFFQTFAQISEKKNITFITNAAVRETILNISLTALAPALEVFGAQEFQLWFQVYLVPVMPSLRPAYLWVIPKDISCASYMAILTGLQKTLKFPLPLELSVGVNSSIAFLKDTFPRCSTPEPFTCKETAVDENLICAEVNRSLVQQTLAADNSSAALCSFTITEHACSMADQLAPQNLATLLKCWLESQTTYPVEAWKLFFQKVPSSLNDTLETFATMTSNNSRPALSNALDALREVRLANLSDAELQSRTVIGDLVQRVIGPFLASPSTNFLFCLSSYNFSCLTYQIVVKELSNQRQLMNSDKQRAVFTYFIKPFLSRKESSDPGCTLSANGSQDWLQANLGSFAGFATVQDLTTLNPHLSPIEILSELAPSQVAQLLISTGSSNDTTLIDLAFERLEKGDALENLDKFLTQLTVNGQVLQFQTVVRDHAMTRAFYILRLHFLSFSSRELYLWFHERLLTILASFTPQMLNSTISSMSCANYHIVVSGIAKVFPAIPLLRRQGIASVLLAYLQNSTSVTNRTACRMGLETDVEWIETNLGPFSQYTTYSDLKAFNLSQATVVGVLTEQQKAELILDPDSGALEDVNFVREVLTSLNLSGKDEQLSQFFQTFAQISEKKNITFITNAAVRETILNISLTALAPALEVFGAQEFQLWFQVYLVPVMPSLRPAYLWVIPKDISCASYMAILTGLQKTLKFPLPLELSVGVNSSIAFLKDTFPRCSTPEPFTCKETAVDENLICAEVNRSLVQQTLAADNSSAALCSFTITEHACSMADQLAPQNLATLLKCWLESQTTYPVEAWKLFFQKVPSSLNDTLETFATMTSNNSRPALSNALDALREVRLANLSDAELQSRTVIGDLVQRVIGPFLASPSTNFLFCLSSYNFSCLTYQIVVKELSNQRQLMNSDKQRAVFTYFIKPFLSRKESSDPGCTLSANGSQDWLQANLGSFAGFATVQDLTTLNPHLSPIEILSELAPSQVAQLLISTGSSNDTTLIDLAFERLEKGDALENLDKFLTQLTVNGQVLQFQTVVRDHAMTRAFYILRLHFLSFSSRELYLWFHERLLTILASFTPQMLNSTISSMSCANYHIVVSGIAKVFPAIPLLRRQGIASVLLAYLQNSTSVTNRTACRMGLETDVEWIETNLGPFSQYTTYSDLKAFNLSQATVVGVLTEQQKAELILDPDSGALEDVNFVREVLTSLNLSGKDEQLSQFFQTFAQISEKKNITFITNAAVRETILNISLTALAPALEVFGAQEFQLWFQVYLVPVMPSLRPAYLWVIPKDISCASYMAILTGLQKTLKFPLPLELSVGVNSSIAFLKDTFPRCSTPEPFTCKETAVDENLICAEVNRSLVQQTLAADNSSAALCSFTITEHACSMADQLAPQNLATLLKCWLESQTTYPVEAWKLFFQKVPSSLNDTLETFATMTSNNSRPALSNALDALREVRLANLSDAELQSRTVIGDLVQRVIGPFLASPSTNFLFCLSSYNFSCLTYQIVVKELSNQRQLMNSDKQRAVFTYFIKPFLSRKESSDPGCTLSANGSQDWLQANLGSFAGFATVQDLTTLNPHLSPIEILSELAPSQVAQLLISTGSSNDTTLIDLAFERLEKGDALENLDKFLTQLTVNGQVLQFQTVVRDHAMTRAFYILRLHFLSFSSRELYLWFHERLLTILASFTPQMLNSTISSMSCANYHIVVSGIAKVFPAIPLLRRQGIASVLLAYLQNSTSVTNRTACRMGLETDVEWIETNLGPFSQYTTYSDLKAFNLSQSNRRPS
ncbi:uncharacterized protein LOC129374646 [Poeciliopsis prolifica]|uniref:uncharacterized protein LOC129374646 n=2 Tax=Poeciliopsis prolifica TaxID=188132 RepID=UPI002413596B|nr:uncharacterized protein LOC129374646 [Poeciliopsis prolifica]